MTEPRIPYYRAPEGLRERVQAAVRKAPAAGPRRGIPAPWMLALAATLVLMVAAGTWRLTAGSSTSGELNAVVDAHLRALVPGHLADVASTSHHTVKPWFAGKLDFSPPVADLESRGWPLVGGRVDVVDGRSVAAIVYSRRAHIIDVFVRPLANGESAASITASRRGINAVSWTSGGMRLWAVSDLNARELSEICDLFEGR